MDAGKAVPSESHFGSFRGTSAHPIVFGDLIFESAEEGNRTLTPLRAQRPERCVSTSSTTSARCSEMVSAAAATYRSCQDEMSSYRADSSPIDGIGATGVGALKTNEICGVYRKVAGAS
jgi:hypothetical protein